MAFGRAALQLGAAIWVGRMRTALLLHGDTICEQPNTFGIRTGVRINLTIREQRRAAAIRFPPIAPMGMPVEGRPISQHKLL